MKALRSIFLSLAMLAMNTGVAMAQYWQIREQLQADATYDLRVFNSSGAAVSTVVENVPQGGPHFGPALGSEMQAAGIGDGIVWSAALLQFDPAVVTGNDRNTLYSVIAAHDPSAPAPEDPFVSIARDMFNQATLLLAGGPVSDATARAFLQTYVDWYELFP